MKQDRVFMSMVALAAICAVAGIAISMGAEGQPEISNFLYRIATFLAFGAILWYAAIKKLLDGLKNRRSGIEKELDNLETRRIEAEKRLAQVERSIANIASEREAIFAEYHSQGEAMKASIIAKAEESARQMTEQAKRAAENEVSQAIEAMRSEMADLIVQGTEKLLAKKLSADAHEKLIDKYLTKVVLN